MAVQAHQRPPVGDRGAWWWWVPRLLFVVGAVGLVVVSASGWSLTVLYVALAFFGLVSAFFVGRQVWLGHRAGPWLVPTGLALSVAGVATLIVYAWVRLDVLPLLGAVLLVLGLGWLVEAWRTARSPGSRRHLLFWGIASLVLCTVLAAFAVVGLGQARGGWYVARLVILGVALFVVLPIGLNLLSEYGLRRLAGRNDAAHGKTRFAVQAGTVVLAVAVMFIVFLLSREWILTAIVAASVVFLILAIVSNTHADVALVLAGLALIGAAPPEHPMPGALTAVDANTLVVLGDSYMSGEGSSSYFAGTDDAGGNQCRRAPSAYAVRVATDRFDHVAFLACSGARTYHVISRQDDPDHAKGQTGEPGTQIDQMKELKLRNPAFQPALVVVGLGGNDAGFGTLVETCLAPGDCSTQRGRFEGNLPNVERALIATYASLQRAFPRVPIVVVPYPEPIADVQRCNGVALTKNERDFIREFIGQLNDKLGSAASTAGVAYAAEMKDSLAVSVRQLCGTSKNKAGINFVDVLSVNGVTSQRFNPARWLHNSMHPNNRGHDAMLQAFALWLDANPSALDRQKAGPARLIQPSAAADAVAAPAPQCSMTDASETRCQTLTRQWALGQVAGRAWVLVPVLAGLLLVWAASIAVLSVLRRRHV